MKRESKVGWWDEIEDETQNLSFLFVKIECRDFFFTQIIFSNIKSTFHDFSFARVRKKK